MYPEDKRIDAHNGEYIRLKNYMCSEMIIPKNTYFSIETPELHHSIEPLETCYMIMLAGVPFYKTKGPKSPNGTIKSVSDEDRKDIENKFLYNM
jgi:hypothetical protein